MDNFSTTIEDDEVTLLSLKNDVSCSKKAIKTEINLNDPVRFSVNLNEKKQINEIEGDFF